ncbi:MAG: hypothetical protein IJI14_02965 [Anaerolineaceae bacterium]|nr:hypothetical protein [Anaerolineaceae bacterium]
METMIRLITNGLKVAVTVAAEVVQAATLEQMIIILANGDAVTTLLPEKRRLILKKNSAATKTIPAFSGRLYSSKRARNDRHNQQVHQRTAEHYIYDKRGDKISLAFFIPQLKKVRSEQATRFIIQSE